MKTIFRAFYSMLPSHFHKEMKELYASSLILNFAVGMIQLFEPIYLYTLGYGLQAIVGYYFLVYLVYFFILPLGSKFASRFGYEKSILISTFIFIAYYILFYNIANIPGLFFIAPLLYAVQKIFYWPAYHADFADNADYQEDAREIAGVNAAISVVQVVAPLTSGLILEFFGFEALFTFASIIFILSNIPLLITKETVKPKSFSYKRAFKDLLSKKARKFFLSYLGYGEEAIATAVWPVFMMIIITDFFGIGSVVAIATFVTIIAGLYVGKLSDSGHKVALLRIGTLIYSLIWFVRVAISNVAGIFLVDTLSRVSKRIVETPLVALTYERAQSSALRSVSFYEMSLVLGKLIALMIVFFILFIVPMQYAFQVIFIIAGMMAFMYRIAR